MIGRWLEAGGEYATFWHVTPRIVVLAYQAYLDRTATLALMIGKCQREKDFPTFEKLTGRKSSRSGNKMSATVMAHNIQLWRFALGQAGDAQQ